MQVINKSTKKKLVIHSDYSEVHRMQDHNHEVMCCDNKQLRRRQHDKTTQEYMQQEWGYYDRHFSKALEAVGKRSFYLFIFNV
ncbi:hypothetical protein CFK37_03945 [Virgibacillus phasianinus]|uniref:Uncharacterized protein n=1 Tax=Virgibacillus phasianinus TaxID=2017483 RepID=A0A220TZC8_9BACI|nr:hypothetical protein [Virgibacillus phasianinus]ASK61384.1 hypothetical protein CFK37_03945 [Virgibacillus phasianinus]